MLEIIRGHENQDEGYKLHKWEGVDNFPTIITIFSSPNYCHLYNNKGAFIKFINNTMDIRQITSNECPCVLPNFCDLFTWTLPHLAEYINSMIYHSIKKRIAYKEKEFVKQNLINESKTIAKNKKCSNNTVNYMLKRLKQIIDKMNSIMDVQNQVLVLEGIIKNRITEENINNSKTIDDKSGTNRLISDGIPKNANIV